MRLSPNFSNFSSPVFLPTTAAVVPTVAVATIAGTANGGQKTETVPMATAVAKVLIILPASDIFSVFQKQKKTIN